MANYQYTQLDVFATGSLSGNPLAVVHGADALGDREMQSFARWTNLSETTFLLAPSDQRSDYRVRIFTPQRELPFAGHPTLGSCHAWLAAGGTPQNDDEIVQECGLGIVRVRRSGTRLAFAAPPTIRGGPVDENTLDQIKRALGVDGPEIRASQWVDNGPGWVAVLLRSREDILALRPDYSAMAPLEVGVVGPCLPDHETQFEVRAFIPGVGGVADCEDPVTGSLNASLAQWLIGAGLAPDRYVASQGTVLGRAGRVFIERDGDDIWVGGDSVITITGQVEL
jgi:PhzF family phenazine biosynthesis protein